MPTLPGNCALCHRIYEHLKNNYEVTKLLQQAERESLSIRTRLLFETKDEERRLANIGSGSGALNWGGSLAAFTDDPKPDGLKIFDFILRPTKDPEIAILLNNSHIIDSTTDSLHTFQLARIWLDDCLQNHPACRMVRSEDKLPSRLLELNAPSSYCLRLQDTSAMQSRPSYMTLSHCWGEKTFLTLNANTQQELRDGMSVSKLAQTFQDAIRIALGLRAEYLWIDSLCIFQDSKEDWNREAPLMAAVYRGSTCNIGASASESAYDGCFRNRDIQLVSPTVITTSYTDTQLPNAEYMIEHRYYSEIVHERTQPLFSRGWVFQERVLAPRMLHFGTQYTFWECDTSSFSEKYPNGYPNPKSKWGSIPVNLLKEHEEERFKLWAHVVRNYASLALTYARDRLIAISGVARHLQTLVPSDKYLAGLWNKDIMQGLLWYSYDPRAPYATLLTAAQFRPLPYLAPTWSWASTIGRVEGNYSPSSSSNNTCTIQNITFHHATSDIYGEVLHGVMKAKGHLLKCNSFNIASYLPYDATRGRSKRSMVLHLISLDGLYDVQAPIVVDLDSTLDSYPRDLDDPVLLGGRVYLFPLLAYGGIRGLLLLPTSKEGWYERCGVFRVEPIDYIQHAEQHEFWTSMKTRAKARQDLRPEDDPFEIIYKVGPREEEQDTMPASDQSSGQAWKEYEEFDGEDYTFSIV